MNEFDWCENAGRELFLKVLAAGEATNIEFSTEPYSIWDAKYTTRNVLNIVEIKVRKQNYNTYPDWILELKKYNALKAEVVEQQKTTDKKVGAIYINFFNDGYFCIWGINKIDATTVIQKSCKATTAINGNYYIDKSIIPLKIKDSVMFGQIVNNQVKKLPYED